MIGIDCRDGSYSRCLDVALYTFFTDRMSHSRPLCYSCSPSRMVSINRPAAVPFSLAAGGGSRNFLGRIEAVATSGSNFVSSGIGAVTLTSRKSRCLLGSTILLLLGRLGREI